MAAMALGGAAIWLRGKLARRKDRHRARLPGYAYRTLLLACFLLVAIEGATDARIKETVFDGWLDSAVDAIDGTDDREEWIARHREGGNRGYPLVI
jgi:hypothetical protein